MFHRLAFAHSFAIVLLLLSSSSVYAQTVAELDDPPAPKQLQLYHTLAERGNAAAQAYLGHLYQFGIGVPKSIETAVTLYRQAANSGQAEAQFAFGMLLAKGTGVERDDAAAQKWLRLAADQNEPRAMRNLATQYFNGRGGLTVDYDLANQWYEKAAALGDGLAMAFLGLQYETGLGVIADFDTAIRWYQRGIAVGEPMAQLNLGKMYIRGAGVPQDVARGLALMRTAAEKGDSESAFLLGGAYATGDRVEQNVVEALMWLIVAADPEVTDGRGAYHTPRDRLSQAIEPAQRRLAEDRAEAILKPLRRKPQR